MVQVLGTLVTPTNQVSSDTSIRFTALNSKYSIKGMQATVVTDADGKYDFTLVEGTHSVEILFKDEYTIQEEIVVDGSTPSVTSLTELLNKAEQ